MAKSAERDRAVERLLKGTRREAPAVEGVCLDVDVVAAWADGSLSTAERKAAEAHAADCARCQALLASMVRTTPPALAPRRGARWAVLRWAVPLTTAAAAATLWFVVDRSALQKLPSELTVEAPATRPADAERSADTAASRAPREPTKDAPPPQRRARARTTGERLADRKTASERADESTEKERTAPEARAEQSLGQTAEKKAASPEPAPPAAVPTPSGGLAETVTVQSKTDRDAAAAASEFRTTASNTRWTHVAVPNSPVRWRFSAAGGVERSNDGGATWTPEQIAASGALTTGSAPAASVCWLAGRGGIVLRFTTQLGWQRFTLPGSPDVAVINAKDEQRADVMLSDGSRLRTTDGGRTWANP